MDCLQSGDSTDFLHSRVSIHPGRFSFPGKKRAFVSPFCSLWRTTVQVCDWAGMAYMHGLPRTTITRKDPWKGSTVCVYWPAPSHPTPSFKKWQVCNLCLLLSRTMRKFQSSVPEKLEFTRKANSFCLHNAYTHFCYAKKHCFVISCRNFNSISQENKLYTYKKSMYLQLRFYGGSENICLAHLELDLSSRFVWRKKK